MNFFSKALDAAKEVAEAVQEHVEEQAEEPSDGAEEASKSARATDAGTAALSEEDFEAKAHVAIPGSVFMVSGCHDTQTSADVSDVSSFELPEAAGPGGAGGAATCSLLATLHDDPTAQRTWVEVLGGMRAILKEKSYEQIPQLSSSMKMNLSREFSVLNPEATADSKKRALLIGINYVGQRGELSGCHNDALSMKTFLETQGFEASDMRILMDDGENEEPTAKNILDAFDWVSENTQPGDSLVVHYSGHGGHVRDESKDEEDGRDETLVPVDFQSAGQIIDDIVFRELVLPVPAGVTLFCLLDCCHSGTILDLPYMIQATPDLELTGDTELGVNPSFSFKKLLVIAKKLYAMQQAGTSNKELGMLAAKELMPMMNSKEVKGGLSNLLKLAGGAASSGDGSGSSSSGGSAPSGQLQRVSQRLLLEREDLERQIASTRLEFGKLARRKLVLAEERKELAAEQAELAEAKRRFQAARKSPWFQSSVLPTSDLRRVRLTVGGQLFETSEKVLKRDPGSLLAALAGKCEETEEGGAADEVFCIDRDWFLFRHILAFLRDGSLPASADDHVISQLYKEADFYNLETLRCAIRNFLDPHQLVEKSAALPLSRLHTLQAMIASPGSADHDLIDGPAPFDHADYARKRGNKISSKSKSKAVDDDGDGDWWTSSRFNGRDYSLDAIPSSGSTTNNLSDWQRKYAGDSGNTASTWRTAR